MLINAKMKKKKIEKNNKLASSICLNMNSLLVIFCRHIDNSSTGAVTEGKTSPKICKLGHAIIQHLSTGFSLFVWVEALHPSQQFGHNTAPQMRFKPATLRS